MIVLFQIAVIIFDAWYQAFHIEKNRFNIPHGAAAKLVSMFAIMSNLLIALFLYQVTWAALVYFVTYCIQFIGLRAVIFDPAINKFRGKSWFHRSKPKKGDISKIDKRLQKYSTRQVIWIKSIFLLLCLLTIKLIVWLYFKNFI